MTMMTLLEMVRTIMLMRRKLSYSGDEDNSGVDVDQIKSGDDDDDGSGVDQTSDN